MDSRRVMASREFKDTAGTAWMVWDVTPQEMSSALRKLTGSGEERRAPWLAFQSETGDKRRLVPVPQNWLECTDEELLQWWSRAARVPPAPARRSNDQAKGDES